MSGSTIVSVSGRGLVLRGHDIDTDRIIPARFLRAITFDGLERFVFADDRAAATAAGDHHPFDEPNTDARILIVNNNFGCGSSREHAPQALQRWGVKAVVGESFAEIFFSNSLMLGLPCISLAEADIHALMALVEATPSDEVVVDVAACTVGVDSNVWTGSMPAQAKDALTSGHWDGVGLLLQRYVDVDRVAAALPYGRP